MKKYESRIKELGYRLPDRPKAVAAYVTSLMLPDNLLYVSGQTAKDGSTPILTGKVGDTISLEDAYEAAKNCALILISEVKHVLGDLDRVKHIVKLNGYINGTPDFTDHPKVMNGASDLMEEIFGEAGKHSRTTIGVGSLPDNASVEVEMIVYYE